VTDQEASPITSPETGPIPTVPRSLDRASAFPLHSQLASLLSGDIRDGIYPTGSSLPSEAELQDTFGVARSVVRQALASLTIMGLIERVKGSGSTVTSSTTYHRLAQSQLGLAAQLTGAGSTTTTAVVSFAHQSAPIVEFDTDATGTLMLERVRAVNGTPIAFIRTWLPLPLCDSLNAAELVNASLHETMQHAYGTTFSGGTRHVRAAAATDELATTLDVAPGTPVLILEGVTVDDNGRVVEKFATWHRADLISLDFSL
jgi:GntR family transcriptional regulator